MRNDNLPDFPGAAIVYERAQRVATFLNRQAYQVQRAAHKGSAKRFRFSPSGEADHLIRAMNAGDEETLKAVIAFNLAMALDNEKDKQNAE